MIIPVFISKSKTKSKYQKQLPIPISELPNTNGISHQIANLTKDDERWQRWLINWLVPRLKTWRIEVKTAVKPDKNEENMTKVRKYDENDDFMT